MRKWAGSTLVIAATGATALLYGAGPQNIAVLGDAALAIGVPALITAGIILVRRWLAQLEYRLTDTAEERRQLAAESAQCQVMQLAINGTRERLLANAASAEAHLEQRIADATAAIRQEFEEARAVELAEAYEAGAVNERNGVHKKSLTTALADLVYLADRRHGPAGTSAISSGLKRP